MLKLLKPFLKPHTSKALQPSMSQAFCIYTAYLNPEKHIYMNHNPTNTYEDILQIGDYVVPGKLMEKEMSQAYVPQITTLIFNHLKKANVHIYIFYSILQAKHINFSLYT